MTTTPIAGNGMYIWDISQCDGGDIARIIARCQSARIDWVAVKAADGTNVWAQWTGSLVSTLRSAGLRVLGWQYIYGSWFGDGKPEANAALTALALGPDGWIIDAEAEIETKNTDTAGLMGNRSASSYCTALANAHPTIPLYLSSFPITTYHPHLPYDIFRQYCAAFMPQIYWHDLGRSVSDALDWTLESVRTDQRIAQWAIVPTGQTYDVPVTEVADFAARARTYWPTGVNWWSYQHTAQDAWPHVATVVPAPPAPTPPPFHAGVRYRLLVDEHLRFIPVVLSPLGVLVTKGSIVTATGGWTTNWREVTTAGGHRGWVEVTGGRAEIVI